MINGEGRRVVLIDLPGLALLVPSDFSRTTVSAPTSVKGSHLAGKGWTIDLAPGWTAVPGARPGSYVLTKQPR